MTLLLLVACGPKHPDLSLRRDAAKANRALEGAVPAALADDGFAVPPADAIAATVAALEEAAPVVEVSPTAVAADWSWSGSTAVDAESEYFDQGRARVLVAIRQDGPEVRITGQTISGTRRARPTGAGAWTESTAPLDLARLKPQLVELEEHHLRHLRSTSAAVLDDFEEALPSGFEVVERTDGHLRAESVSTSGKAGRKGSTASWDARETLEVRISADGLLAVAYRKDDRFTAGSSTPGDWEQANVSDAPAVDWTLAALRQGYSLGHLVFGDPRLPAVAERSIPLSEPPAIPRLRTMEEVQEIIAARAVEQRVGRFNVCVDVILVNPTAPGGTNWDLPGVQTALAVVEGTADVTAGGLAELNKVADAIPPIGEAVDVAIAGYTGGAVDRHHAQMIAVITRDVSGFANANLGYAPDVTGVFGVGPSVRQLVVTQDQLHSEQHVCATADFRGRGPAMKVEILDQDVDAADPIGSCSYSLDDVISRGAGGISCGYARVFPSAQFVFGLDQIEVVGLPPPEPASSPSDLSEAPQAPQTP